MKKPFLSMMSIMAATAMYASSDIPSQMIYGEAVNSISENGIWMISEGDMERSAIIRNLQTGKVWKYIYNGSDFGDHWDMAVTQGIANDGTAVGEFNDVPSYWRNGVWTPLQGPTGKGAAIVGGITPDGSMIVGGFSDVSLSFEDRQMTFPCVWYRNEDGTYGAPEFLPNPGRDLFGMSPQYVHSTAVSRDGNTVAAIMTSGSGFYHFPYVFTRGTDGEWSCRLMGMDLINPRGIEVPRYPGDYNGPMNPNYEEYMSPQELSAFYAAGYDWIDDLYSQGITDENEITLREMAFAMEFMSADKRAIYEPLLNAFLEAYVPWWEAFKKYEAFLDDLNQDGIDFMYNNVLLSPDGKYLYASASQNGYSYYPVRFDVATGESVAFKGAPNTVLASVTDAYDVFVLMNGSKDNMAYVFPENDTQGKQVIDLWRDNAEIYNWLEENLYRQVVTGFNQLGGYILDDRWTMGKPYATPDMSLVGFAVSTENWYPAPTDDSMVLTCILNTGLKSNEDEGNEDASAELIGLEPNCRISALANGNLLVTGEVASLQVYDTAGALVFSAPAPSGTVQTGLSSGIYIVRAVESDGRSVSAKIRF